MLIVLCLAAIPGCQMLGRFDAPPNLRLPTLGGKHVWSDRQVRSGWRVQQNILTRHHRLLDARNVRHAWGSYRHCVEALNAVEAPLDLRDELVVFLHGAFRSRQSLRTLQAAFEAEGYDTLAIDYASAFDDLEGHARRIGEVLDRTPTDRRVHFVAHSLGGLVVRKLLGPLSEGAQWRRTAELGRVCMIFTPNQGAMKANLWHDRWWFRMVFGRCSDELTSQRACALPIPPCSFAVIAGGRGDDHGRSRLIPGDDDGTVGVLETMLDGMEEHLVVDVGHTLGIHDPRVVDACVRYVRDGAFRPPLPEEDLRH